MYGTLFEMQLLVLLLFYSAACPKLFLYYLLRKGVFRRLAVIPFFVGVQRRVLLRPAVFLDLKIDFFLINAHS